MYNLEWFYGRKFSVFSHHINTFIVYLAYKIGDKMKEKGLVKNIKGENKNDKLRMF